MLIDYLIEILNELPLGDKGRLGSLRHLVSVIGGEVSSAAKNAVKEQVIYLLNQYYRTPGRFEQIWNSLSDAERKIISMHIWAGGLEPSYCADEVAEEYGIAEVKERAYYSYSRYGLGSFKEKYSGKNSALWLLFPLSGRVSLFYEELRDAIGEMKRKYSSVSAGEPFTTREHRTADFTNIVRFCNSNRLTVTKGGILSKASALKVRDFCGYEEFAADTNTEYEDMRTTQGLLVTLPLTVLCTIGGLLTIAEGECLPSAKALSLIDLPHEQLVKHLFNAYLKSKSFDEISLMKGLKARAGYHLFTARQSIAGELKKCPIGQAVYTKEFEWHMRIANSTFARKDEQHVVTTGSNYENYAVEWEDYEHPLIAIILSFFSALGMIDIEWGEGREFYTDFGHRIPIAFKINQLGAYVLDMSKGYTAPAITSSQVEGGFTVLPDYTIVVPDSANRIKHDMYFEKLFTKVSATKEAGIYKLDFETVVRAADSGASVADLRAYLTVSDKPVPENIARALDGWEKQAGRIRLRQVTVLECDDEALLEEVIRYKGMAGLVKEKITAAVVVDGSAAGKIKKAIEKNKRFCKNVL